MPGPIRYQKISVTAACATGAAVAFTGVAVAAIWVPMRQAALTDDQFAAGAASVAAVILWTARWLASFIATCGIAYVIDLMLSQRAWYRNHVGMTGPLRLRPARHAR